MGKIFEWDARSGNYIESVSKEEGTPVSTRFSLTGKGFAVYLTTASSVSFTVPSFDLVDIFTWAKGSGTLRVAIGSTNNDITLVGNEWVFDKGTYSLTGEVTVVLSMVSGSGYVANVQGFDAAVTIEEENRLTSQFNNSYPYKEVNRPSYTGLKPTDLSLEDGLLVAYNMVPENGTVLDISGNGNTGDIYGPVSVVDGMYFDGVDDYITFPTITTTDFSVCMRINPLDITSADVFFSWADNGITFNFSSGLLRSFHDGAGYRIERTLTEREPFDIVLTYDGTDYYYYIDGINVAYVSQTSLGAVGNILGSRSGSDYWNGEIHDFRVYSRALSLDEIRKYHDQFSSQVKISDRFIDEPVGNDSFLGWQVGSGGFKAGETQITETEIPYPATNSGGDGTTDWIDTNTDGLADNWTSNHGTNIFTIVTGNGFTGNAQRFQKTSSNLRYVTSDPFSVSNGSMCKFSFKYRTNNIYQDPIDLATAVVQVFTGSGVLIINHRVEINNGNAVLSRSATFEVTESTVYVRVIPLGFANNWIEIDEVELIETVFEEILYPPEVDLSSFTGTFRYLECETAGTISTQYTEAYGQWEFDVYKPLDGNTLEVVLINQAKTVTTGRYSLTVFNDESIGLRYDSTELFRTVASYIDIATWYRFRVTRSSEGEFYVYIKGGSFGQPYQIVDVTGGSGTNPVTNNSITTSRYLVLDMDTGDSFRALKTKGVDSIEQANTLTSYFPITM